MGYKPIYTSTIQPSRENNTAEDSLRICAYLLLSFAACYWVFMLSQIPFYFVYKEPALQKLATVLPVISVFVVGHALLYVLKKSFIRFLVKLLLILAWLSSPLIAWCFLLGSGSPEIIARKLLPDGRSVIVSTIPIYEYDTCGDSAPILSVVLREDFGSYLWKCRSREVPQAYEPSISISSKDEPKIELTLFKERKQFDLDSFMVNGVKITQPAAASN